MRRGRRRGCQARTDSEEIVNLGGSEVEAPANLYELLGVRPDAEPDGIKQAYYDKMKVCHPDVAGDDGEEMCMLLNDAYDLLSDSERRAAYDEQALQESGRPGAAVRYDPTDLAPTWQWQPKRANRSARPTWTGRPYSRSLYERVAAEDRGERWASQQFVYVDEWTCIACRNCCDVAPQTFCIDMDAGRARVYAQWGNSEENLDYAVSACPVDCIYWVSREELQALEFVTREKLHDSGDSLPCPMSLRQGGAAAGVEDPFFLASEWRQRLRSKQAAQSEKYRASGLLGESAAGLKERIQQVFGGLTEALRWTGWGR